MLLHIILAFLCAVASAECASDACETEPSALVQLGAKGGNSTVPELSGSRRRRTRRRRSRRRAGTYTGTIPYKVQVYCGYSWLTLCEDVPQNWEQHNGAFDESISTTPPAASNRRRAKMNYITLGGDGVTGDLPKATDVEDWISSLGANNLDFDLEGSIKNAFSDTATLLSTVKSSSTGTSASTKGQATCLQSQHDTAAEYKDDFDYFGVMIHGQTMLDNSYSIPQDSPTDGETWTYIQRWLDSDVPNDKIILSLTTRELTGWMIDWFKSIIAEYGLAGMSFWYWQGDDYQLDSSISIDCIQDQGTQCDSSSSYKCSQMCSEDSKAAGYCCDSNDMTYYSHGTAYYCKDGLEACCGGTDDTSYCQKV